ncbi:MAG: response regulator [Desulfobacterales bacterium]|nr:response regulator [Desulfobacterales bacterium]
MREEKTEIVLIEDNPTDAELTLHALKKSNLANNVKVLRDGEEALEYLFSACPLPGTVGCPYLILLDLKLPKISGLEVLEKIRSDERTKMIPVVVLTSSAEEKDRVESYKLGVNSYIVKPVEFDNFAKVVAEIGFYWILLNKRPY